MVRPQLKKRRIQVWNHPTVPETKESARTQVKFYRILAHSVNLPYACPLCLGGYGRYDALYAHFKATEEPQHKALKSLWFGGECTVCKEPSDQILRHVEKRHPENYQPLMKSTLRLRSEVDVKIPAAPDCFQHTFFFSLRRSDSIVTLPRRKRKTAKPHSRQEVGQAQDSKVKEATPLPSMELVNHDASLLDADESSLFGTNNDQDFLLNRNTQSSHFACTTELSPFAPMETFHGDHQADINFSHRGYLVDFDTGCGIEPWDLCYPTGSNKRHLEDDVDCDQFTRDCNSVM